MVFSAQGQISGGDFWNCFIKWIEKMEAEERFLTVKGVGLIIDGQRATIYLTMNWRERFLYYFFK